MAVPPVRSCKLSADCFPHSRLSLGRGDSQTVYGAQLVSLWEQGLPLSRWLKELSPTHIKTVKLDWVNESKGKGTWQEEKKKKSCIIYVFWKNSCIQWVREQWGIPMYRQSWCHHCALLPATTVTTILGQCCVSLRLFLNVTQSFHSGMISLGYLPEEITFFFHYEDFPSKNEKKNLMSESRRKL